MSSLALGCGAPQAAVHSVESPSNALFIEANEVQLNPSHPAAQLALAQRYEDGRGVRKAASSAAHQAHLAAKQNYAPAEQWLATRVARGEPHATYWYARVQQARDGETELFGLAISRLQQAAQHDDLDAMFGLGIAYESGQGVPENDATALEWFTKAGGRGHPGAECHVGLSYVHGRGVPKDDAQAFRWYLMAALLGEAEGEYQVALFDEQGKGTPQNLPEAVRFYRSAAEHGRLAAQLKLAALYEQGKGVPVDGSQALLWYERAAAQGDADARAKLARLRTQMPNATASAPAAPPTPVKSGTAADAPADAEALTPEQQAVAARIQVSQFDGYFSEAPLRDLLARELAKPVLDDLVQGKHLLWIYGSSFKLDTGRRYCFATLGLADRPAEKGQPRFPGVLFSGLAWQGSAEDDSSGGVAACRARALRFAIKDISEAAVDRQQRDIGRTATLGKPYQGEKADPDSAFVFSSGFDDRSYVYDSITSEVRRAFDYRKLQWVAIAHSFNVEGHGVCIAAAGVAARAPIGRNPHVPGAFWEHIIETDAKSAAQDPDLENCKARSAAAAVTQARLEEWDKTGLLSDYERTREEGVALVKPAARPKPVASKSGRAAPQPFDLVLGRSSVTDARAAWKREGGAITSNGNGYAKPGARDNDPDGVPNPRVNLIDVKGLPMDGLYSARFGFFDATLYLVDYEFADGVDFSKLLLQVVAKYGQPDRPAGNTYDWQFGDVRLTLERSFMGRHTMTFLHQPIRSAVSTSHAAIYAAHIKNRAQSQRGF